MTNAKITFSAHAVRFGDLLEAWNASEVIHSDLPGEKVLMLNEVRHGLKARLDKIMNSAVKAGTLTMLAIEASEYIKAQQADRVRKARQRREWAAMAAEAKAFGLPGITDGMSVI